jgi:hypothetical protein
MIALSTDINACVAEGRLSVFIYFLQWPFIERDETSARKGQSATSRAAKYDLLVQKKAGQGFDRALK